MYKLYRIHSASNQRYVVCVAGNFDTIVFALNDDMEGFSDEGLKHVRWEVCFDFDFDVCSRC